MSSYVADETDLVLDFSYALIPVGIRVFVVLFAHYETVTEAPKYSHLSLNCDHINHRHTMMITAVVAIPSISTHSFKVIYDLSLHTGSVMALALGMCL
jgi:hypothetical protein